MKDRKLFWSVFRKKPGAVGMPGLIALAPALATTCVGEADKAGTQHAQHAGLGTFVPPEEVEVEPPDEVEVVPPEVEVLPPEVDVVVPPEVDVVVPPEVDVVLPPEVDVVVVPPEVELLVDELPHCFLPAE
ncbi:hypothetical protein [Novosphingobium panipatense]